MPVAARRPPTTAAPNTMSTNTSAGPATVTVWRNGTQDERGHPDGRDAEEETDERSTSAGEHNPILAQSSHPRAELDGFFAPAAQTIGAVPPTATSTLARPERPGPQPLPVAPLVEVPESTLFRLKNKVLGPLLHTTSSSTSGWASPRRWPCSPSDALSSTAYASEEILRVLIPVVGVLAFSRIVPITLAMVVVLVILMFSYRQTIKAYPSAGGAYIVTKDNLGLLPAQVAGVALLTDYILTVAVSVSAGVAALFSAFPAIRPYRVPWRWPSWR